jgi:hypothetical protein
MRATPRSASCRQRVSSLARYARWSGPLAPKTAGQRRTASSNSRSCQNSDRTSRAGTRPGSSSGSSGDTNPSRPGIRGEGTASSRSSFGSPSARRTRRRPATIILAYMPEAPAERIAARSSAVSRETARSNQASASSVLACASSSSPAIWQGPGDDGGSSFRASSCASASSSRPSSKRVSASDTRAYSPSSPPMATTRSNRSIARVWSAARSQSPPASRRSSPRPSGNRSASSSSDRACSRSSCFEVIPGS